MLSGFIVKKVAMDRIFLANGEQIAVTRCASLPLTVTQVKDVPKDGYQAVQLAYGNRKRLTRPISEKLKKLNIALTPKGFIEFKATGDIPTLGSLVSCDLVLKEGDRISATGTSKGKGYAGVIKRHKFHRQGVTGGQSDRTRAPGSIGAQTPGKVVKGKKMPGHMGNATVTTTNLKVVKVDSQTNQLFIAGGIPGSRNSWVIITKN